jgi:hypothetical protein
VGAGVTASGTGAGKTITIPGGGGSLTSSEALLGGNVTLSGGSGSLHDGPSLSLAAGTYLVLWKALVQCASGSPYSVFSQLWDGVSTIWDESETTINVTGFRFFGAAGFAIVTLGTTTTVKTSFSSDGASNVLLRDGGTGANHEATRITAIKIA